MASKRNPKTLIAIGGHEDKEHDRLILRCVAEILPRKKLVVATLASEMADEMWQQYRSIFKKLGVTEVVHLNIGSREEVHSNQKMLDVLANAGAYSSLAEISSASPANSAEPHCASRSRTCMQPAR